MTGLRGRARGAASGLAARAVWEACTLRGRPGELAMRALWQAALRRGYTSARVVDAVLGDGDVAVDVGASIGYFSRRMLQLVGPRGAVRAIEPNPGFHDALEAIVRRHENFRFVPAAASDTAGTATLHVPRVNGRPYAGLASVRAPDGGVAADRFDVPRVRLDDVLAHEHGRIAFIKVDVEGHEIAVLDGAARTLEHHPSLLIEVEQRHHAEPIDHVFAGIMARGYDGWAVFRDGLRPISDFDVDRDQLYHLSDELQHWMPRGYVNDFLFVRAGVDPPLELHHRGPLRGSAGDRRRQRRRRVVGEGEQRARPPRSPRRSPSACGRGRSARCAASCGPSARRAWSPSASPRGPRRRP